MGGLSQKIDARDPVLAKIEQIRRTARRWTLMRGYLWVLLCVVGLVFAGVLLDHAWALQRGGRAVFLAAAVLVCAGGVAVATAWPLLVRVSSLFVARHVERSRPELKNCLISYLQCRDEPRVSRDVKRLLRERSRRCLRSVAPSLLAQPARSARLAWALAVLLTLFALYAAFFPKSSLVSVRRLFAPAALILPPTRTRIVSVKPGECWVLRGEAVAVSAEIVGVRAQSAGVIWSGQSFADKRVLLSAGEGGAWTGALPAVLEDGHYCVVAGDTRSEQYSIAVLPRPVLTGFSARATPPAYTRLPERQFADGNLDVVSGSVVRLTASTNVPPARGYMDLASGGRIWLDGDPERRTLTAEFTAIQPDSYRVFFDTVRYADGSVFRNSSPVTFRIDCRADLPPRVEVHEPPDGIAMAPDGVAQVRYNAEDDFGLRSLTLKYAINGAESGQVPLPLKEGERAAGGVHEWRLSRLSLRHGDVVGYFIVVTDNWDRGPHVASSPRRTIRIVAPEKEGDADAGDDSPRPAADEAPADMQPAPESAEGEAAGKEPPGAAVDGKEAAVPERDADGGPGAPPSGRQQEDLRQAERVARAWQEALRRRSQEGADPDRAAGTREGDSPPDATTGQGEPREGAAPAPDQPETAGEAGGNTDRQGEPGQERDGQEGQATCRNCGGKMVAGKCSQCSGAAAGDGAGSGDGAGRGGQGGTAQSGSGDAAGVGPAQHAPDSTAGAGGAGGARGTGPSEEPVTGGPVREGAIAPVGVEEILSEVQRGLEDGSLPEEMLDELGMNRRQLEEFIERYMRQARQRPAEGPPATAAGSDQLGRILEGPPEPGPGVAVQGAGPATARKDSLRARFEDGADRISPRYRDALNAYYKKLSEQR